MGCDEIKYSQNIMLLICWLMKRSTNNVMLKANEVFESYIELENICLANFWP